MLKVIANIYSDTKEKLEEVASVLTDAGYEIAYNNENNAVIIKDVESLED